MVHSIVMSVMARLGCIVALLLCLGHLSEAQPESKHSWVANGYVKYLPSARFGTQMGDVFADHLIHNRFNFRYNYGENFTAYASVRTRLFYGSTVRLIPFFDEFLSQDNGLIDASHVLLYQSPFLLHSMSDRFYIDWKKDKWQVTIGRQRINWGINMVSNPNDLFNTYSFFDFDYEERPGADAIRVQYYTGTLSRLEVAVSPAREIEKSVAAAMYTFNRRGYDFQLVSGYFRHRAAMGAGWAGNIKNTGFKGEVTYFRDLEPQLGKQPGNLVGAISMDHRFKNEVYLVVEYLYNQQRSTINANPFLLTEPFSADNLSFTDHAIFANASYPISPVLSLGLAGFYYPSEQVVFFSPNINASLTQSIDFLLISQIFAGSSNSMLTQGGYLVAMALKWSF